MKKSFIEPAAQINELGTKDVIAASTLGVDNNPIGGDKDNPKDADVKSEGGANNPANFEWS